MTRPSFRSLIQDIGFGRMCGFQSLLVLTGAASKSDMDAMSNADYVPDYYLPRFADFVTLFSDLN